MFSVLFEVQPRPGKWDDYLDNAKMLHPELERINGFVDNIRYKSLQREGWILSLSSWRDEKSLVRWRTTHRTIIPFSREAVPIFLRTIIYAWARYLLTIWSLQECICCTSAVTRQKSAREQWSRLSRQRALRAIPPM